MQQLFQNLIANGLKFHKKEVTPVVKIYEKAATSPNYVNIVVEDNGVGFDSDKHSHRIFEMFQRLHGRHDFEGTGMGLSVCQRIAERHGGSITPTSKVGCGATFSIQLPLSHKLSDGG